MRSRLVKRLVFLLPSFLAVLVLIFSGIYYWRLDERLPQSHVNSFQVKPGDNVITVALQLYRQDVFSNPIGFSVYMTLSGKSKLLKYGSYALAETLTYRGLGELLVSGKATSCKITLVEGWTFQQFLETLRNNSMLSHGLVGKSHTEIMALLGGVNESPEGHFFPDTYYCAPGMSDLEVLKRAWRKMNAVLDSEWRQRDDDLPLFSPYKALILASLIEKETSLSEERAQIAGVFVRRLKLGMKLQTDPTVIYGMGADYQGNIRKQDLIKETPYNTYVNQGLPPTPIAMPGRESLHATLHPAAGKSLYFVSRGNGAHVFSDTIQAHQLAVEQYQLNRHDPGK